MGLAAEKLMITADEYLSGEKTSEIRHQLINGDIYAMAGGSEAHNLITGNAFAKLHQHLKGKGCRVFMSDMKTQVKTDSQENYYYPDIQVTCATDNKGKFFKSQPVLIIEVLSDSTERFDRAEKFYDYRKIASLQEYVLIAQDCQRIEVYRKSKQWNLEIYQGQDKFYLDSVDLELQVAEVYDGVEI